MSVRIHAIPLGLDRCYLLQGDGAVLIDGGAPNQARRFCQALESLSIAPQEIRLVVLTHGHWDHFASAKEIKEATGADLAMHWADKDWLEKPPSLQMPPGPPGVTTWGRIIMGLVSLYTRRLRIPAAEVDVVLENEGMHLADYGIPGQIIHTPGHSPGSVSVLLETGEAFVGDLAMAMLPMRFSPGLPIFAEDIDQVKESWRLLLRRGAEMVYPAHGKPFTAEVMRKTIR